MIEDNDPRGTGELLEVLYDLRIVLLLNFLVGFEALMLSRRVEKGEAVLVKRDGVFSSSQILNLHLVWLVFVVALALCRLGVRTHVGYGL